MRSPTPPERPAGGGTGATALGVAAWAAVVAFAVATAGGVDPAAGATIAAFLLGAGLSARSAAWASAPRSARLAVTAAIAACAITLVPLPEPVRAVLAPGPTAARADLRALGLQGTWAPISVDVGATALEGAFWVAAGAVLALFSRREGPPRGAAVAAGLLVVLHAIAWIDWQTGVRVFPLTHIEDPWSVGQDALRFSDFAGWLVNRNHWATLGLVLWPLAAWWGWRTASARRRAAATVLAALVVVSVLATRSRAAFGVVVLQALAGGLVFAWRTRGTLRWLAYSGLAATLLLAWGLGGRFLARLGEGDVVGRADVYAATARMALDSPVVGWGMGSFQAAFPAYQPEGLLYTYSHAHDDPLEWIAGAGVLGLVLVGGLAWTMVRGARDRAASPLARTLWTLAVAGVAAAACVEFPLHVPAVRFAWLCVLFAGPPRGAREI